MKKRLIYIFLFIAVLTYGCKNPFSRTNWSVSLQKEKKDPYGSFLAFESLKYFFPNSKTEVLSRGFRYSNIGDDIIKNERGKSLMILLGLNFHISAPEFHQLMRFAGNGNEIIIFCSSLNKELEDRLQCYKNRGAEELKPFSSDFLKQNKNVLRLATANTAYGYEGRWIQGTFHILDDSNNINEPLEDETDSPENNTIRISLLDTLGTMNNTPNFIRYQVGKGHVIFHAAPLVMSNYFLLQKDNINYLKGIWAVIPDGVNKIYWNEYYKHEPDASDWRVLWKYPSTRWGLLIAIATLMLYVLFEGKRRQRIIPVIEQPQNSSVSFAETVGRLYFNKGDHGNLAEKMIQHFLDWVRTNHNLNTNVLNDDFARQLARRTGQLEIVAITLINMIHEVRLNATISEERLYDLHKMIDSFYKNNI